MRAVFSGAEGADYIPSIHGAVNKGKAVAGVVRRLDSGWIDQILELQEQASDGQTILRDRDWLEAFFARGDDAIFGIADQNGRLVGQATTRMHTKLPSLLKKNFNTAAKAKESHAGIGCVTVHPDCRGQGLMAVLIEACTEEARSKGMTYAHARVRQGNAPSLQNFMKKGFAVIASGPSPEDETRTVDFLRLKL